MLLEQNLFWIYRLILKAPRAVYYLIAIFLLFVAVTQIIYLQKINKTQDFSPLLFEYVKQKHEYRLPLNSSINDNQTSLNATNGNQSKEQLSASYAFLDQGTVLDFKIGKDAKGTVTLNYTTSHDSSKLPVMFAIRNQQLSFMSNKSPEYLKQHGITYDLIELPQMSIQEPFLAYFFQKDMQNNQLLIASFGDSYKLLDARMKQYLKQQNITEPWGIDQLYLSFFFMRDSYLLRFTMNIFNYIVFGQMPGFFIKAIYSFEIVVVLFVSSVFMGLLIRYAVIALHTAYLIVFDLCIIEDHGWARQFLLILYRRYRQGRLGTIKMIFFYSAANIGLPVLLAFGAYCILDKLVIPMLPLLIDDYAVFFLEGQFAIEVFHYVMVRSRTATRFFPLLSFVLSFVLLLFCGITRAPSILMLLNLHFTIQLLLFVVFLLIEKSIYEDGGLGGGMAPSSSRPRMLFYAGFDISWQKSLPPLWTYFTRWFDYSHFDEAEKCFLEKDYQLLYGRMLGLNQRQEIPQEDYQLQQLPSEEPSHSNEMHLIQE